MFSVPTLIVNEAQCKANIKFMAKKAAANNVVFRPHFKTHQDIRIGEWFRNESVNCITVSSVRMAILFADNGWKDITIAFPLNFHEIDSINELAAIINLNIIITNEESIDFLKTNLKTKTGVFIETDCGYNRTGVDVEKTEVFKKMITEICKIENCRFKGLLAHFGNTYSVTGKQQVLDIYSQSLKKLNKLKDGLKNEYENILISIGDTPSCSLTDSFEGVDEIRPGNFAFYDVQQLFIGSCVQEQIALYLLCPVVDVFPERDEIVVYGGAVHLSKDSAMLNNERIFGLTARWNGKKRGCIIPDSFVKSLSQEHGIIKMPKTEIAKIKPGDFIAVLPTHSCLTASEMKHNYCFV
ncbi:MAG: hypothetical protein A2491_18320 [Bacteroidetes bacterium RIFOXYC12_FULL_35_7]|nr:MAG: hypothetical protein A2491_18320 [Bacteroidetes bacterium RIFOXYC12_FULL_35_7]